MTPAMSFISVYFIYTVMRDWPDTELKKINFAQNEILYKHPLIKWFREINDVLITDPATPHRVDYSFW